VARPLRSRSQGLDLPITWRPGCRCHPRPMCEGIFSRPFE
jgi:hypothetical protein